MRTDVFTTWTVINAFIAGGEVGVKTYNIPVSNGILEDGHFLRMGSSVWTFLWFVDRTTKEWNGWGLVLGGKPIKTQDIADGFMCDKRTIKRHIHILKHEFYILTKRTAYGIIVVVAKSKKRRDKNVTSGHREGTKTSLKKGQKLSREVPPVSLLIKTIQDSTVDNTLPKGKEGDALPSPDLILEGAIPKVKQECQRVADILYDAKIWLKAHAFKNKCLKKKYNPRAVLYTLCQVHHYKPDEPWGYAVNIMAKEDGNFNERDFRKTT